MAPEIFNWKIFKLEFTKRNLLFEVTGCLSQEPANKLEIPFSYKIGMFTLKIDMIHMSVLGLKVWEFERVLVLVFERTMCL